MTDGSRVALSAVTGAIAGAVLGYLYLTTRGSRLRTQLEPRLDDFITEVRRLRSTVDKARLAAAEGWDSLNELVGEEPRRTRFDTGPRTASR